MSNPRIHQIMEAFSMQPAAWYIGQTMNHSNAVVDRIVEESVYITGDPYDYYVGYDKENNRLFEFKKGTVNVIYE